MHNIKTLFFALWLVIILLVSSKAIVQYKPENTTVYTPSYVSKIGEIESRDVQCPIPMEDRVPNYTGNQCVWSSIETLGRWADEPKIINPPITSRRDCKGSSGPNSAASKLKRLEVRFKQSYGNREEGTKLIKEAMQEGRGALFGVTGHAMVLIHYDKEKVKWIDNADSSLKIQTMSTSRFLEVWDSWVLVIYADKDIVSWKINPAKNIPIVNLHNPDRKFSKDFILLPKNIR